MAKRSQFPGLDDFVATLVNADVLPVYAVFGEEEHLKAEAIVAIKAKAIGDGDAAMCYSEFDGATADCKDVFDELRTLPFLANRRVVLLEKADKFLERFRNQANAYVESPASSGTLILSLKKLDSRTKIAKALGKWRGVVECKRLYENQVPGWIVQRMRSRGKKIDTGAARMLAEHVGSDLGPLSNQIEKIITFVGDRDRVTSEDVAELTITDRTRTIFELTECIGRKDTTKALTVLNQLTNTGGEAVYIISMLAWQLRRLWKAKHVIARHSGSRGQGLESEVAKALGVSPYFVKDIIRQAAVFSDEDMGHRYRLLLECDIQLKSAPDDPMILLEKLMLNLCR